MFSIGGLLGSLTFGYFCDKFGRVWALRIIAFLHVTSYLFIAFNHSALLIIASRFTIGIAAGASYIAIPMFVSEIAEDE
jgi:MFS family permease